MEQRLLAAVDRNPNLSPKSSAAVLSLITNPCTSESTLTTILDTLNLHLQNPNSNHQQILSLLSTLSHHHPRLRRRVGAAVYAFILVLSTPTPALPHALSLLDAADSAALDLFSDETLFLSLCFYECVKTRVWMLRNVSKFRVRPSVLLTVLLGFTKDPYPYIRKAALDGLVMILKDGVVVEDRSLVGGCYFRAAELLFDAEISMRRSAVRVVSEWGQLHVALIPDESKRHWSDALFLQLCLMVSDMDVEIRVAAFNALGKIPTVSENILLQTLSKKALPSTKEKIYPGQYTAKLSKIPATAAAFAFLHGLEDEFFQVRRAACRALQTPTVLSADFSRGTVDILMDTLNDDSLVVRLQALETLHHMATYDHLKVVESHLHMLEPSFDGKLGFNKVRTAALFVLAISAPVSLERQTCSIPPEIFSYAVTLLGRISCGLVDVVDQNTLLTYLSQCSRFTFSSTSEKFEGGLLDFGLKYNHIQLCKKSDEVSSLFLETTGSKIFTTSLESHVKAKSYIEILSSKKLLICGH